LIHNAFSKLAHPTPFLGEVPHTEHCRASDIIDIISNSLYMLGVQNMKYLCESIKKTFLSDGRFCRQLSLHIGSSSLLPLWLFLSQANF